MLWKGIFGEAFLDELYIDGMKVMPYLVNSDWEPCQEVDFKGNENIIISEDCVQFVEKFMSTITDNYVHLFQEFLIEGYVSFKESIKDLTIYSQNIEIKFLKVLLLDIEQISMRVIIQETHEGREKCFQIEKYPVLERCIKECISRNVVFFSEMLKRLVKDKSEIEKHILGGDLFDKLIDVEYENADAHMSGKRVTRLKLNNDKTIIYKPHNINNEKWFNGLLACISDKCSIDMYFPKMIIGEGYGWIEHVEYYGCKNEDELKRYYLRIGVILFVTYLLGSGDLHFENMIARGEYPIIVDLEVLTKVKRKQHKVKKSIISDFLEESVLYTGILPYYHWNDNGKGVDLSAIAGGGNNETFFYVPVLKYSNTKNMQIQYAPAKIGESKNRAMLNDIFIQPSVYEKEIVKGFETAYTYVLGNKGEIRYWIDTMNSLKSRYLVADTQKYAMLLSTSYHPMVMHDAADREFLMYSLWKGRSLRNVTEQKIVNGEIYDLLNGDIPYFSCQMNSTALFDSRKNEILDFFVETPMESINRRLNNISENDLERQKTFIRLSLSASNNEKIDESIITSSLRKIVQNLNCFSNKDVLKAAEYIGDKLLDEAVYNECKTEIDWFRIIMHGEESGALSIYPCGKYIYDGLSGIGIFLHLLKRHSDKKKYVKACSMVDRSLFLYTDQLYEGEITAQSRNSGIYNGEGSIVYYYLILYSLYKNKKYIAYAKKHAEVLRNIVVEDINYDLLDGKAGAILTFCFIYKVTHEMKYIKYAEEVANDLIQDAIKMANGIGWKKKQDTIPLLGMAHGNAGILVAVGMLYQLTNKERYLQCIEKALVYEHENFDLIMDDWKDFRDIEQGYKGEKQLAWCHGAGGILLSRIFLSKLNLPNMVMKMVSIDIERASSSVEAIALRKELCLCHGTCGNMLILDAYKKLIDEEKKEYTGINITKNGGDNILTREWFQPGLMNGYTGIGYYLMLKLTGIPNYIFLDI